MNVLAYVYDKKKIVRSLCRNARIYKVLQRQPQAGQVSGSPTEQLMGYSAALPGSQRTGIE